MEKDNYIKAYKEVVEILKHMPQESVNKIPKKMLDMFNTKMDKEHNFKVDVSKNLEEQELMEETKAILANIYRDYWATPEKREKIIAKEKYDRQKIEEEKRKKYNPDDIFKKNEISDIVHGKENFIEGKEKLYIKLIRFIKNLFHIS